ncbi:MAG: TolC family protein [Prevotella sp.]|nr:TolC family protein [Prevotella sp.]
MKKIFAILACSVCCGLTATAQQAYSLDQLKQLANENNYTMHSAKKNIQQAGQMQKEAFTKYFPTVSAMGMAANFNKPLIEFDLDLPAPLAGQLPGSVSMAKKGLFGSVSAVQPVFMGGLIINANKLAKVGKEASEISMEASADKVELTTEQYYWKAVTLKEKLNTLNSVHAMLVELEKDVNNMVRAGVVNRNDLLQVQLRKGEIECSQIEVENGLTTVCQLLAQHVGKADEAIDVILPADLATLPAAQVPALPVALRKDHQTAVSATTQYRMLEKNVETQRLQHKMKVGQNLPKVGVGVSYSYNDFFDGSKTSGAIFAGVNVPLSAWWGGSHAIKKQKLAYEDAKEQLQDSSQKLVIRMNNAWSEVETSHKKLLIANDAIYQADENLRLNRDYYRVGQTKMTDLLTAQEKYQSSRDRYTDAYADFQTKQLEYRQATAQ